MFSFVSFQQVHYGSMERFGEPEKEKTNTIKIRQDEKVKVTKMEFK